VQVRSIALVTELAIAATRGRVTDRGDYVVVETPDEPGWIDGNYLVLPDANGGVDAAMRRFAAELGDHRAIALRWDDPTGVAADREELLAAGFTIDRLELLVADEVLSPPHAVAIAELSPSEMSMTAELAWALADRHDEAYRQFLRRRAAWQAQLVADGRARFFGAHADGNLVASVGLVQITGALARYQDVQTASAHRRRGLAGALLATAWRASAARGTSRVAIVAEPASDAARVYRRVGFARVEQFTTACRQPIGMSSNRSV